MAAKNTNNEEEKLLGALVGSKAELNFATGLYKGSYISRVEDFSMSPNDNEMPMIGLAHPMFKGALLPISRGLEMTLKIDGQNCFYQSEAEIVKSIANAPIPMTWVRLLSPLSRVQRRAFVRVSCNINASACFIESGSEPEEKEGHEEHAAAHQPEIRWFPLIVKDISLGGVGAEVGAEEAPMCQKNSRYLLNLTIDDTEFFLVCSLVKIFGRGEDGNISVGLSYEGISAFVERLMLAFIRQQELRMRS